MSVEDLLKLIREVGAEIQPKLLPIAGHSSRNAYAHIHGVINALCGSSYSEADPSRVVSVVEAIRMQPNASLKEIFSIAKEINKGKKDKIDA